MVKVYEFKDKIDELPYEELLQMKNVLADKILLHSRIEGGSRISNSKIVNSIIMGIKLGSEIGIQGWQHDMAFSAIDHDTVGWSAGTITLMDGTTYSIGAGSTGDMAAITYVYLDIAVSITDLQVTTVASTAVGAGKILICVAQNVAVGNDAIFQVLGGLALGGIGKLITASDIVANTITANEIAANTITAAEMNVAQLSAIAANLGTITAGNITLDTSGYIRGGQTAFNIGTGFFLGYEGGAYKFSIGVPTGDYMTWDGATLVVSASKIVRSFMAGMPITAGETVFMHTDGKVYSTNAAVSGMTNTFLGFCLTTTATGSLAPIQTFGVITGLSGLTIASTYYLQNCSETQDQAQTSHANGSRIIGTSETAYQSFTTGAGVTQISSVSVEMSSPGDPGHNFTLRLRTGEGTGGSLLGSKVVKVQIPTWTFINFLFDVPIIVSPSTQYSITLTATTNDGTWGMDSTNPYAGGRNNVAAGEDYSFKTYYSTARGAIGTSPGTVSKKVGFATTTTTLTKLDSI